MYIFLQGDSPSQRQSQQCSTNVPDSGVHGKKCKLLNWRKKVVAEGTIASTDPTALVHHVPLGADTWKVWVDVPVEPQAEVWRETSTTTNLTFNSVLKTLLKALIAF